MEAGPTYGFTAHTAENSCCLDKQKLKVFDLDPSLKGSLSGKPKSVERVALHGKKRSKGCNTPLHPLALTSVCRREET